MHSVCVLLCIYGQRYTYTSTLAYAFPPTTIPQPPPGHTRSVSEEYATSVSHIFTMPNSPERTILMAPASTSALTAATMEQEFGSVLRTKASMVSTEISQVPLSGVRYLLEAARQAGKPSLLDFDVTPEVALGPAQLGASLRHARSLVSAVRMVVVTALLTPHSPNRRGRYQDGPAGVRHERDGGQADGRRRRGGAGAGEPGNTAGGVPGGPGAAARTGAPGAAAMGWMG